MSAAVGDLGANPFRLDGKTVLVTGASSGIGRQTCIAIARMGGRVVATGRHAARLQETIASLTAGDHAGVTADLTAPDGIAALADRCPSLDGVVHSAGITRVLPIRHLSPKLFRELSAINLEAPLYLTRELLRASRLQTGASVVLMSAVAAHRAVVGTAGYAATKAGLIAAARVLALELAPQKIRCNCLCPGLVRTPMLERAPISLEQFEESAQHYPLGLGDPADVAHAAVFLLSDASRWVTGASIVLDGGFSCR